MNHGSGSGITESQMRLRVGPLELVMDLRHGRQPLRWAWPGGRSLTYGELVRLAHARGWRRPELVGARVLRATDPDNESPPPAADGPPGAAHE